MGMVRVYQCKPVSDTSAESNVFGNICCRIQWKFSKIRSPVEHIILGQNRENHSQNGQMFTRFARGGAGEGAVGIGNGGDPVSPPHRGKSFSRILYDISPSSIFVSSKNIIVGDGKLTLLGTKLLVKKLTSPIDILLGLARVKPAPSVSPSVTKVLIFSDIRFF